jgi:hypothetical protein
MIRIVIQLAMMALLVVPSVAEDWVVSRVRGTAQQMVGGQWVDLVRGATVLDRQVVRTGPDGRVGLARGAEVIELAPDTSIELREGAGKLTSLIQSAGVITVDVERRNVQHFSVQTPFLAAVVKGTRFQVSVAGGVAHVDVERGVVQVQDTLNDLVVDISHGQEAEVSRGVPLTVSGAGLIAVFTFDGMRVVNGTADIPADNAGQPVTSDGGAQVSPASANTSAQGGGNAGASSGNNAGGGGNGNSGDGGGPGNGPGNSGNGNGPGNGPGNPGNGHGQGNGPGNSGNGHGNPGNGHGNPGHGQGGPGNSPGNGNGNNGHGNGGNGAAPDNGTPPGHDSQGPGNGGNGNGGNGNGNGNGNGRG